MSNGEDETIYQTLKCYNILASDPSKHSVLVKDKTMLQFLAYTLDSNDYQIIQSALNTLDLLSKNPKNRSEISGTFGILEALKATYERNIAEDLQKLARHIYNILEDPFLEESKMMIESDLTSDSESIKKKHSSNVFSFHVFGLNNDSRGILENTLIRVKGVVSVVICPDHQRCIVRATKTVTPELLVEAIAEKANLKAHLVVKNRLNQEVLKDVLGGKTILSQSLDKGDLSPIQESVENNEKENQSDDELPPYLPEEESPVKEKAINPFDRFKTNAASWVKTATSLFQNSFYW